MCIRDSFTAARSYAFAASVSVSSVPRFFLLPPCMPRRTFVAAGYQSNLFGASMHHVYHTSVISAIHFVDAVEYRAVTPWNFELLGGRPVTRHHPASVCTRLCTGCSMYRTTLQLHGMFTETCFEKACTRTALDCCWVWPHVVTSH